MMKVLPLLFCCVLAVQAKVLKYDSQREWEDFVDTYRKIYKSDVEIDFRYKIFADNLMKITLHNELYEAGKKTFKMAINRYADMLEDEIVSELSELNTNSRIFTDAGALHGDIPDHVDWISAGAVTPVKDVGECGPAWPFATTGAMEAQLFKKTGELVGLSEQQLLDCSVHYGNRRCTGGDPRSAFEYCIDHGIDTEMGYPYEARGWWRCRFDPLHVGTHVEWFHSLPRGDEQALKEAVALVGPISVGVHATEDFIFYSSGVLVSDQCGTDFHTHNVLVVGYGTEDGQDYWLAKNCWGEAWGDQGYIKMARNYNNMCGIANMAHYPEL